MKKILKCGMLFTADDETILNDMAIVVEDNIITDILPVSEVDETDAEEIDLSNQFVMPGLIDAHMHCTGNGETQDVGYLNASEQTINGVINLGKDLMAGFTTIRDEGCENFEDVALKKAIEAGRIVGPRMVTSGKMITATGGHADSRYPFEVSQGTTGAIVCDSPDETRKAARTIFKYGADQLKLMGTGGVMSTGDEPGAPELTYEEMKAALDIANERGRISSIHAHGAEGIKRAIRAGIRSVEHGMLMDDEAIDMLAESGVYLIPTIVAAKAIIENGVESGINLEHVEKAKRCLAKHYDNLKKCYAKGVQIGFGTDAGTPGNYHGTQTREFGFMVEAGLPPMYVLQAATCRNAALLNKTSQIGSIVCGKYADVIAVDGNPLLDMDTMNHVRFVMKDGIVYKNEVTKD